MKLLIFSDIHADTAYLELLDDELNYADAVIFAGDFACFQKPETGAAMLELLAKKHDTIFAVTGNCDNPDFVEELERLDVSVQKSMVYHEGLLFSGAGGALKFTGVTPNERTDEDLISDLNIVEETLAGQETGLDNLVLVVHQPPQNTKLDLISAGIHVGSPALRSFIEKHNPILSVSGHIHESAAIDTLGNTTLINPGSLAEGRYATAELVKKDGVWEVVGAKLHELRVK